MKRCGRCGEWKPLEEYGFRVKAMGTRQSICRDCTRIYRAAYDARHSTKFLHDRIAAHNRRYRALNRRFVDDYLAEHPCVDCGESDIVVLEFDHVHGDKRGAVSALIARAWSTNRIAEEIAKCEVRCANCHRRRTAATRHKVRARNAMEDALRSFTERRAGNPLLSSRC